MSGRNKPNIVIPTCRPRKLIDMVGAWRGQFTGCHLIIVHDQLDEDLFLREELLILSEEEGFTFEIHNWRTIEEDLGESAWIIPRRTSGIRSYGYYRAYINDALFVVTLDDDVEPERRGHIAEFGKLLLAEDFEAAHPTWYNTMINEIPRGTPSVSCEVVLAHGCWLENPDLSAKDQLAKGADYRGLYQFNEGIVPLGAYFSMCGMNLAFRTKLVPHLFFGLQGELHMKDGVKKLECHRTDDIMAGMWVKKVIDETIEGVVHTGGPYVVHKRASNVWKNLEDESLAEKAIETWGLILDNKQLNYFDAEEMKEFELPEYFMLTAEAYKLWYELFGISEAPI